MKDDIKQNIKELKTWLRGLYMLLFLVLYSIAKVVIFAVIALASAGCSSRNSCIFSLSVDSTADFTSEETSLSLVCEENFGSGTFTESTAVRPSRASSPETLILARDAIPSFSIYWFKLRVKAARKPAICVPPSFCGILFVKG